MESGKCSIKADFLDHPQRKLFYLLLEPTRGEVQGSILYLPPFTEELNKSRRIVASQARALAESGYRVMLLDLSGCGDGAGEFVDASWQTWLEDAQFAADTLVAMDSAPLMLWGLRLGALLATEVACAREDVSRLLLWQPVLNGEQQIDQFLRLEIAATALHNPMTFDRKALWKELRAGGALDIAGYQLSSRLALELSKVRLDDLTPPCAVSWIETGGSADKSMPVASDNVIGHWRERGVKLDCDYVIGEPFWRTIDARVNPELQGCTLQLLVHP